MAENGYLAADMLAIPEVLRPYAGRMLDVDAHEAIPMQLWEQEFGPATREAFDVIAAIPSNGESTANYPAFGGDVLPIDGKTIWEVKGSDAPGSVDMNRRLEVMDLMGVSRQLVYPGTVGIIGAMLFGCSPDNCFFQSYKGDRAVLGRKLITASNDWVIRTADKTDRLRPVAVLLANSVKELMEEARALIDNGVRAVWLPNTALPGGVSPAHTDLDPFWDLLVRSDVTVTTHIGGESGFISSQAWANAPAFEGFKLGIEFDLSPWHLSVQHLPSQNFVSTMVLGGVFERHPGLCFGVIEVGGYWVGPMAYALDIWHKNNQTFGATSVPRLARMPSEYINSNIRVSTFPFEPVDDYIDKFGLEDVYCYASDYPHIEGGKYSMHGHAKRLERHGLGVMEKFFVTNGEFLMGA